MSRERHLVASAASWAVGKRGDRHQSDLVRRRADRRPIWGAVITKPLNRLRALTEASPQGAVHERANVRPEPPGGSRKDDQSRSDPLAASAGYACEPAGPPG